MNENTDEANTRTTTISTTNAKTTTTTCCQRLRAEINPCTGELFSLTDPATGQILDIQQSFAFVPNVCNNYTIISYAITILWKLLIVALGLTSIVLGMTTRNGDSPAFFFAFLSNWAVTMCFIYLTLSLINIIVTVKKDRTENTVADNTVVVPVLSWRILLTWISFIIGIHTTAVATVLFWFLLYDPNETIIKYVTISAHGGLLVLVFIDGLVLNRIPIRFFHWITIILPFDILFILWSILHDLGTTIGNPDRNDNDSMTNDDSIYENVLEWKTKPTTAIKWTIITLFVVGFVLFALLWTLSTYICGDRLRYLKSTTDEDVYNDNDNSNNNNKEITVDDNEDEEDVNSQDKC